MEYNRSRNDLKRVADEARIGSPDTLNVDGPTSVVEGADIIRRLAFHEQLQLANLNAPLIASELAFPFQPEDIRRADPLECDVLTNTEGVIKPAGSDHAMALIKSTRGVNLQGEIMTGKFDSIFMTNEAYSSRGGKVVVVTDKNSELPDGQVQGKVCVDRKFLEVINADLANINRIELPLSLADKRDGADQIVEYDIIPAGPWEDKTNKFFYERGHIGLVLKLSSGKSVLLTHNALNERKEQGSINLVRFPGDRYGIVNTVRMLVGAGHTYRPEISRGYADVHVARFAKTIEEKYGIKMTPDQVGMELGLNILNALNVTTSQLRQDYAYENVTPKLQVLDYDNNVVMKVAPDHVQHLMEEFEGISPLKMDTEQILKLMDNGTMVDGFSIAVFASEFLQNGKVVINPKYIEDYVVLEERSMIQLGGGTTLVVPSCPAFDSSAKTIGQVDPNTGNARFWYQARHTNKVDNLQVGPKYVKVEITKVTEMLKNLDFSTVDAATLFRVLFNQRIFIPNF